MGSAGGFEPSGLAGLAYWYGICPLRALVFRGMLQGIARAVLAVDARSAPRQRLTTFAAE